MANFFTPSAKTMQMFLPGVTMKTSYGNCPTSTAATSSFFNLKSNRDGTSIAAEARMEAYKGAFLSINGEFSPSLRELKTVDVTASLKRRCFEAAFSSTVAAQPDVVSSAVYHHGMVSIGHQFKFATATSTVVENQMKLQLIKGDLHCAMDIDAKRKEMRAEAELQVSKAVKMAAKVMKKGSSAAGKLAVSYAVNGWTTVAAQISSEGRVGVALKQRLTNKISGSVSAGLDAFSPVQGRRTLGVGIEIPLLCSSK